MLNDLPFFSSEKALDHAVCDAKFVFKEEIPYTIMKGEGSLDDRYAMLSDAYGPKVHHALDYGTAGNTIYMSERERIMWFAFGEIEVGHETGYSENELLAAEAMDFCLVNAVYGRTDVASCSNECYAKALIENASIIT